MKKNSMFFAGFVFFAFIILNTSLLFSAENDGLPKGKKGRSGISASAMDSPIYKYDANHDGRISKDELDTHFDILDGNGDSYLYKDEMPLPTKDDEIKKQERGPLHRISAGFISRYDRDKDKKVSKDEYTGYFIEKDLNGDGYLVESEMR